jgi:hypothetical protein
MSTVYANRLTSFWASAFFLGAVSMMVLWGCAGTSGDGDDVRMYNANLGAATLFDLNQKTRQMFDRYQFQLIRVETSTDMTYYETEWKPRRPFDDEAEQGIAEARTRIIIQATPRTRAVMGADMSTVKMIAENQVRFENSVEWQYGTITSMVRAYLKSFSDDLTMEFRTGMRRY